MTERKVLSIIRRLRARVRAVVRNLGRRPALPPLPRFPERGLRVEAGDSFVMKHFSIGLEDLNKMEGRSPRVLCLRLPAWGREFAGGAVFGLSRRLEKAHLRVDQHRVELGTEGTITVALQSIGDSLLTEAFTLAERTLDLLAANSFMVSTLDDPLREHALWRSTDGCVTLQLVTTARLGVRIRSAAEVRDPTGAVRPQPERPPTAWHPSHAYFRQAQASDGLHDSYRNMFLALEALLSHVYPWSSGMGEAAWLMASLRHACEGYAIDLKQYVGGSGGNPYKRFIREQYRARRCALFHAKLSEAPLLPGDIVTRGELRDATRRLGRLYVVLAQHVTGSAFGGGAMSTAAFEAMMKALADSLLYVSESAEFDYERLHTATGKVTLNAGGAAGVHVIRASWAAKDLPRTIRRAGSLLGSQTDDEGFCAELDVDTTGADRFEIVFQLELGNTEHLREWFL